MFKRGNQKIASGDSCITVTLEDTRRDVTLYKRGPRVNEARSLCAKTLAVNVGFPSREADLKPYLPHRQ